MTQTLRRELRLKFEEILFAFKGKLSKAEQEATAELLADAALSLRAFQYQPQTIEQAIYMDVPVTEQIMDDAKMRDVAPKLFERALGFSKPLPWWDGDKEWKALGEWVIERYKESKTIFGEYNIWRSDKYASGKISNTRLRGFPAEFYDSWDMFMMSRKPKTDEIKGRYEVKDISQEEVKKIQTSVDWSKT